SLPREYEDNLEFPDDDGYESLRDMGRVIHRLLGHADWIHRSVVTEAAVAAAKHKIASKKTIWRLLFQMDSDHKQKILWGDMGRVYYLIPEEDLKKADFSRCWAIAQCG